MMDSDPDEVVIEENEKRMARAFDWRNLLQIAEEEEAAAVVMALFRGNAICFLCEEEGFNGGFG